LHVASIELSQWPIEMVKLFQEGHLQSVNAPNDASSITAFDLAFEGHSATMALRGGARNNPELMGTRSPAFP